MIIFLCIVSFLTPCGVDLLAVVVLIGASQIFWQVCLRFGGQPLFCGMGQFFLVDGAVLWRLIPFVIRRSIWGEKNTRVFPGSSKPMDDVT